MAAAHLLCCCCCSPTLLLLLLIFSVVAAGDLLFCCCCFSTIGASNLLCYMLWLLLSTDLYSVAKWLTSRGKPGGGAELYFSRLLKAMASCETREKLKDQIIDADRILILACYWTPAVHEGMVGDRLGAAPHSTVAIHFYLLLAFNQQADKILFSSIF